LAAAAARRFTSSGSFRDVVGMTVRMASRVTPR
jgi:hypothetical protein